MLEVAARLRRLTVRSMSTIRLLQRHKHAEGRILRCRRLQRLPMTANVPAQVRDHIAKKDHMASPIRVRWAQRSEGDKADRVSILGAGLAVT
jgi:hypothetical protein